MADDEDNEYLKQIEADLKAREKITADTDAIKLQIGRLYGELRKREDYCEDGRTENPFADAFWNATEQGRIWTQNPKRAEALAARAGTVPGVRRKVKK